MASGILQSTTAPAACARFSTQAQAARRSIWRRGGVAAESTDMLATEYLMKVLGRSLVDIEERDGE